MSGSPRAERLPSTVIYIPLVTKTKTYQITENFWVDLVLRNPLDVDVNLSNLTVTVQASDSNPASDASESLEVEVIDDIHLNALESRTVGLQLHCQLTLMAL
jgi:hypothetical protein